MGRTPWAAYLWPGLPQLWRRGSWSALVVAVGAAGLMNLALASSFVWSELLPERVRIGAWLAVAVLWAGSAAFSQWAQRRKTAQQDAARTDDAYLEATGQYLKGNWFEAECHLRELLRRDARDIEAGLMLATLLRHTGRLGEAARQLDRLQRLDGWERWAMEIGRERAYLASAPEAEGREAAQSGAEGSDEVGRVSNPSHKSDETTVPEDSTEGNLTEAPRQRTAMSQEAPGDHADAA
jgi:hypothetical protein